MGIISLIVGLLTNGLTSWFQRSQKKADAKAEIDLTLAKAQADISVSQANAGISWDNMMADATKSSWKDEAWTYWIIVVLTIGFIPGGAPVLKAGFATLDTAPEWFVMVVGASVACSFGLRTITDTFRTVRRK